MKKVNYLFIALLIVFNCSSDNTDELMLQDDNLILASKSKTTKKSKEDKVLICHRTGSGFHTIEVSANALDSHYGHGDINPDMDGDGFTAPYGSDNPCGLGDGTDCDDNNPNVNPGATEVYSDGIDNNCDGIVDYNGGGH
ncbi:putative metal-binding motif-containing protein [Algibacter luteus]|uniref:putative metal-binding motif-containing protein n=1 Tax=Algibacter luteus TaxID=1178825 RepID=UPI00259A822F|nr:putative metal-binding motif-containing protein [Algibacter luteus]WJJ96723.1 putative metal-binding motif-containing protein [Algibacter luteus]